MGKGIYLGVGGAARKMKRAYIGVDGRARKIKKIYIGVEGKARLCYSAGLEKAGNQYGCADELVSYRCYLAAATVGSYALFAGGYGSQSDLMYDSGSVLSTVDAYSSSLTHTTAPNLSAGRQGLAAASVGGHALFGGSSPYSVSPYVDAYNASLTKSTAPSLRSSSDGLAAASVGNYALFGGGSKLEASGSSASGPWKWSATNDAYMDAYDTSLTKTTAANLSVARGSMAAGRVGDYALFAGGYVAIGTGSSATYTRPNYSVVGTVDAYNSSLTRTTATSLSTARYNFAATSVGNYVLFGGGNTNGSSTASPSAVVDVYNASLTRTTATALSVARYQLAATSVGDYALFGGGYNNSSWDTVDVYDTSLTRTTGPTLFTDRRALAATTVGDCALFGGGRISTTVDNTVDVYTA